MNLISAFRGRAGYEPLPDTLPLASFSSSRGSGINFPASVGDTLSKITRTADHSRLEQLRHSLYEAAQAGGGGTLSDAINQFQALDLPLILLRQLAELPVRTPSQQAQFINLQRVVRIMVGSGANLSCQPPGGHSPMVQSAMMFPRFPGLSREILDFVETQRKNAISAAGLQAASTASTVGAPIKDPFFVAEGEYTFLHALAASYPNKPDAAAYAYLKQALANGAHAHQPYQGLTPLNYATAYRNTQFVIDFNRAMEELKAGTGAGR